MPSDSLRYHRVLLKLSGEALKGRRDFGHDPVVIRGVCEQVREAHALGVQLGLVVGGGNIFRGNSDAARGMIRAVADQIGMLGTMINSLALQSTLEGIGVPTRVMSAIQMSAIAEPYIRRRAIRHLEKGRVVIFACGTGHPFFSTDTAGALRGQEIEAEVLLKGTNVDGIYDSDPRKNPQAVRFEHLTFKEVLTRELRVMDSTAFALCGENGLPIIVFDLHTAGNLRRIVTGESIGSLVTVGNNKA